MSAGFPSSDDSLMWALHLSHLTFPSLTAADALGVFAALAESPADADELSMRLHLNRRAVRALLPMLASAGLLRQHLGRYHLAEAARNYLLPSAPCYWGPVLALIRDIPMAHRDVVRALQAPESLSQWNVSSPDRPSNVWTEGRLPPETASAIASYMQANCVLAARALADRVDLSGVSHLLDVGAGAGTFSIAFARRHPSLRCTLMDFREMCDIALRNAREAGCWDRIDARSVDMFREPWPTGFDGVFLSNVFHDWDFETCASLARKAHAALRPGGRILIHEVLLDDTRDGPAVSVAFSMYMLLATKGQQFTGAELSRLLLEAGFVGIEITPSHGFYAIVSATRPEQA
jgi:SAM-dependent methyltransferase